MAGSGTIHLLELSKYKNDCKTFQQQQCRGAFRKSYQKKSWNVPAQNVYEEVFL